MSRTTVNSFAFLKKLNQLRKKQNLERRRIEKEAAEENREVVKRHKRNSLLNLVQPLSGFDPRQPSNEELCVCKQCGGKPKLLEIMGKIGSYTNSKTVKGWQVRCLRCRRTGPIIRWTQVHLYEQQRQQCINLWNQENKP